MIRKYSPLQHCQYLSDILIFSFSTFGKYFLLQLCKYLADLLCNIANIWLIFSSATCQHLENIQLCNFTYIWQIFSSATFLIFGKYSSLQHSQHLADILICKLLLCNFVNIRNQITATLFSSAVQCQHALCQQPLQLCQSCESNLLCTLPIFSAAFSVLCQYSHCQYPLQLCPSPMQSLTNFCKDPSLICHRACFLSCKFANIQLVLP